MDTMEISTTAPPSLSLPTSANSPKSTEIDLSEPPTTRIQPNGVLKRHPMPHLHPSPPTSAAEAAVVVAVAVTYKECMKNHAAARGGHSLDGCGEFMPTPTAVASNPASLNCAACGCHRNFHRLVPPAADYPPPPPTHGDRSPNSESPPPISSSYYPRSAPHMLLPLGGGNGGSNPGGGGGSAAVEALFQPSRKRFRTKFSQDQKGKMYEFAEKIGWKMQKIDEEMMSKFCNEVGVERGVFKVWMHNNKNTFGKKDFNGNAGTSNKENKENNESSGNNGNNEDSKNGVGPTGSESSG